MVDGAAAAAITGMLAAALLAIVAGGVPVMSAIGVE
jgi:hypothetical protein